MLKAFSKPWASYDDQLAILKSRGLAVANDARAKELLHHVNYYRLSGYCLAFETSRHKFVAGTTFEDVIEAYDFDSTLRDLLTEALKVIEIEFRTLLAHFFTHKYGPFGQIDPSNFHPSFSHSAWLDKLHSEANRSRELFAKHFKSTYREFPDLPFWMATEVTSFGSLSTMLKYMTNTDKRTVANMYGLQGDTFASWMHHASTVRNLCAHHSRVWDRVWPVKPKLPHSAAWTRPNLRSNRHLLASLFVFRYMLKRIPSKSKFASTWKQNVEELLSRPPRVSNSDGRMGLVQNWQQNVIWK